MQEKPPAETEVKEEELKDEPVSEAGDGAPPSVEGAEGPPPSGGQGVEVGGTYMVRRADNTWCQAEVIQKRVNEVENQYEYYVHYENFNRRLDEWVLRDRIMARWVVGVRGSRSHIIVNLVMTGWRLRMDMILGTVTGRSQGTRRGSTMRSTMSRKHMQRWIQPQQLWRRNMKHLLRLVCKSVGGPW